MSKKLFRTIVIATFLATTFFIVIASPTSGPLPPQRLVCGAQMYRRCSEPRFGSEILQCQWWAQDPLDILKGIGVNYIRLRIWNNPASGYNNEAKVLAFHQCSSLDLTDWRTPKL